LAERLAAKTKARPKGGRYKRQKKDGGIAQNEKAAMCSEYED
jgi:hypothetical protein